MSNCNRFRKFLVPVILALSLAWLPQPAVADDWQVAQWPQAPDWVAITNHLTTCYNAVCLRYQAAGANPSAVPGPSFVYVYNDYLALGQALDGICGSYIVQTNADGNDCFDTWLAAHPSSNSLPVWVATNLHAYCGFTNWGNNSLLTSWDVCDHSIATQVVQVCDVLRMTAVAPTQYQPDNSLIGGCRWAGWGWDMANTNHTSILWYSDKNMAWNGALAGAMAETGPNDVAWGSLLPWP